MPTNALHVPLKFRRGARRSNEEESIESAIWLIEHMCDHLGLDDLGKAEVLDFGCGVKFTQALINHSLPIKKYVGVDVNREAIDFLRERVHDPRFEHFNNRCAQRALQPGRRGSFRGDQVTDRWAHVRSDLPVLGLHAPGATRLPDHAQAAPPVRQT